MKIDLTKSNDIPNSLEDLLKKYFGCNKLVRKHPVYLGEEDGVAKYDDITKKGWQSYDKLIGCIYALEKMGVIDDANDIVETLDNIIDSKF